MLTEEQAKGIKEQILKQIDSWQAPPEQKESAKKQIQDMTAEELEQFLIKNKMIKSSQEEKSEKTLEQKTSEESSAEVHEQKQQCPFCLISEGKIQAYKIDENKTSQAILEINPLSKGHVLIFPKKHLPMEKIPSSAFSLAKKIAKKIKAKLKPSRVEIQTGELFEHAIINVIPVYNDEKLEKKQAKPEELKQIQERLTAKQKPATEKTKKLRQPKPLPKAPVRIP